MRDSPHRSAGGLLRKTLLLVLAALVLGALVYRSRGIIRLQDFSWGRLVHAVREARGSLLLLALLGIYAAYAVRALRWMRFSRHLGRLRFGNVYSSTLIGFATVFLLGRAGEPVRPLLIARKERLSVSSQFGIYVLERLFDGASTATLLGLSLLVFPSMLSLGDANGEWQARSRTTGMAMLVGLLAAAAFLIYFRFHGAGALERKLVRWRAQTGWKHRLAALFGGFAEGLHAIRTLSDLFAAIAYSAAHWALVAWLYLWVAHSFTGRLAQLDFPAAMLVLAFTMVGSALQLPGVGGGSQVASFLALTVIFGVEKEPAAAASIVLWLVTFVASSLVGVPLLIREGWSMGELSRMAREQAEAAETAASHPARAAKTGSVKSGDPAR